MEIIENYDSKSNFPKKKNRENYIEILARKNAFSINQAEWIKENLSPKYN
jgi:hypothetical protein